MPLHWKASACLLLATVFAAPPANATMALIADGTLTDSAAGHLADLSGLTGTLENGAPANLLGGLGSGIAYAGGNTFLAVPDRGPNAVSYNSKVDDTVSYINRFQTVTMSLTPNASGAALPFTLTPTLTATILLSSPTPLTYGSGVALRVGSGAPAQNTATQFYFTERSDNFDSTKNSGNPKQCALRSRIDPGLERREERLHFRRVRALPLPIRQGDGSAHQELPTARQPLCQQFVAAGSRRDQRQYLRESGEQGDGGVGHNPPDGKTLAGIMQAELIQDPKNLLRIVTIDIATGATHEYGYLLTTGSGVSDVVAINDHQFLVDERDGNGLGNGNAAKVKQLFEIDLTNATDINNLTGAAATAAAVKKSLVLDLVTALNANGIASDQIPAKIEGLAFVQDIDINGVLEHTLFVSNET